MSFKLTEMLLSKEDKSSTDHQREEDQTFSRRLFLSQSDVGYDGTSLVSLLLVECLAVKNQR